MFGFTASPCSSCSPRDLTSTYQSVFCGLSCCLSTHYTPLSRFLVNRDSTFLALLGASLQEEAPALTTRTCCNPLSNAKPLMQDDIITQYASAVTICGLGTKLKDDASDEKGLRKHASKLLSHGLEHFTDSAVSCLNSIRFPTAEVMGLLQQQSSIERGKPDLASAALPTSQSYALIFQHLEKITQSSKAGLAEIGGELGKLIYWRDAFDDLKADQKAGKFNPLTYTPIAELESCAQDAMEKLTNALTNLGVKRNQDLIAQISSATSDKHRDFLGYSYEKEERKKRRREKRRAWCNNCDCGCDSYYCMDACGSGSSGCCDCNPCDGCCCD